MHMQRGFAMGLRLAVVSLGMVMLGMLSSCGGGGSSAPPPPQPADPTGYYENGTLTISDTSTNPATITTINDLQGIIANSRVMMFSTTSGYSFDGTLTIAGTTFTGSASTFLNGAGTASNVPVKGGVITQGTTVSGTLDLGTTLSGSFTLNYVDPKGQVADLSYLENTGAVKFRWQGMIGGSTAISGLKFFQSPVFANALEINPDAIPNGTFDGCYPAPVDSTKLINVTTINTTNLYSIINTEMVACNNNVGPVTNYSGFATTLSNINPHDTLVILLSNGAYHYYGIFTH